MAAQPVSHSCSNTVIMLVVKKHAAHFVDSPHMTGPFWQSTKDLFVHLHVDSNPIHA